MQAVPSPFITLAEISRSHPDRRFLEAILTEDFKKSRWQNF